MGQIDITDFVTNLINSITDEKIVNKADKTYVDDNFVLNTLFEEQINLKSNIDHNHDDRYYTESEMDIKLSEIESSIVGASGFSVSTVDVLPESGEFNTIYLVPSESPTENNKYNNYIWTGTEYDEIGGASPADIDLSDYATLEYLTSELSKYATIALLNTELSTKSNTDHTHDTRYYTESEVDDLFTQLNDILETKSDVGHTHIIDDVSNLQSTLDNKAPSSHMHSRLVPTAIPANADLNDYTTQGSFYCSPNTVSQTVTNTPYEQSFHLEVYKTVDGGVCQVAYSFHQDNVHTWKRNGYNGNWSQWYEIIDTSKVDSSLSASSTNPVQNKIINTALSNKSDINHTHTSWNGIQADAISTSNNETGGYRNIMQIKINGTWTDQPITFDFTTRNVARSVRVFISFNPAATKDPDLKSFKYDGVLSSGMKLYLIKTATSTWNLYCQEVGTYTSVAINNLFTGIQTKPNITITFPDLRVTSLPTGTSYTASEWLVVDTALSSTSTNPVQNKVIYNTVGDIQSALDKIIGV